MRFWHKRRFKETPLLSVIVAAFTRDDPRLQAALLCLVHSFRAQTYTNWEMLVIHDGPGSGMGGAFKRLEEPRVTLLETEERKHNFGHPHRQLGIDQAKGTWLMLTNGDNYYVPTFIEALLYEASARKADFAYCDMVHSHKQWKPMSCQPRYRYLDLGGLIVKTALARQVPFNRTNFAADGDWINRLADKARGRIAKVAATLFVHN